ncbi:regulatory protein, luxR family [Lentibacillus halodurans]|uniref:Regulatory protein, luxR family n=1 Tax=Lentibacillus halodurans TaxID=237679 RepID=A0A1I0YQJ9_9BACI|nr:LuxR C-terminal-related transcriptional regulator [Lentibacillus halodurans]SFB15659.1 regulatory protein, luxR family [Lentibacillus halodurans]
MIFYEGFTPSNHQIQAPKLNSDSIHRERISNDLDKCLNGKMTLVCTAAGFGKTTTIAQWLHNRGLRSAWIFLNEQANDPVEFWRYLTYSIHHTIPELSVQSLELHLHSAEATMASLINTLRYLSSPLILVFDNYHEINHHWIHAATEYLIKHTPDKLHFILSSRMNPPFELHRLQLDRQIHELDTDVLRLNRGELLDYLSYMNLHLSENAITYLEKRTEGWITGINFIVLTMKDKQTAESTAISFINGKHEVISDYLIKDVLNRLPDSLRAFVLRLSLLDHFSPPLCEAVTGYPDAKLMLEKLQKANIFINVCDNAQQWFRFHPLFAEAMQFYLRHYEDVSEYHLHEKAADWFGEHKYYDQAIKHALSGRQYQKAATWLSHYAPYLLRKRELTYLNDWLNDFPAELRKRDADLMIIHAWVLALNGYLDEADGKLLEVNALVEQLNKTQQKKLYAEFFALRGYMAIIRHEPHKSLYSLKKAVTIQPTVSKYFQAGVDFNGVEAYPIRGPLSGGGRLHTTHALYTSLRPLLRQRGLAVVGYGSIILAGIHYERCEWEQARYFINRGKELGWKNQMVGIFVPIHFLQIKYNIARGETDSTWKMFTTLEARLNELHPPKHWFRMIETFKTRLYIKEGKKDMVEKWLRETLDAEQSPKYDENQPLLGFEDITKARALMMKQQYDTANKILNQLTHHFEMKERLGDMIEVFILKSLVFHHQNQLQKAMLTMEQAIEKAEPEHYIRIFLDEGKQAAEILYSLQRHKPRNYVKTLLSLFKEEGIDFLNQTQDSSKQHILTNREIELLQLVGTGMKNKEIATALYISLGSVKVYLTQIYDKLGVNNRTKAVAKARELHILD